MAKTLFDEQGLQRVIYSYDVVKDYLSFLYVLYCTGLPYRPCKPFLLAAMHIERLTAWQPHNDACAVVLLF
jgi:hypothetical protein